MRDRRDARHSIQAVSRQTGLSPETIRAWERRYGAVRPSRSPSGRRLYSDPEVRRLELLRRAVRGGRRIGDVVRLSPESLERLVDDDRAGRAFVEASPFGRRASTHRIRCLEAVERLDGAALDASLARAASEFDLGELIDDVLMPLVAEVGRLWQEGSLRICHEHLLTARVRSLLEATRAARLASFDSPEILVTTPAGQIHELGALMAAATAAAAGWRVTYLGPDLPAEEIASAVARRGATTVALSIVHPTDGPGLAGELRSLGRLLPSGVTLLVGGRGARAYGEVLDRIGAVRPKSLAGLRRVLVAGSNKAEAG